MANNIERWSGKEISMLIAENTSCLFMVANSTTTLITALCFPAVLLKAAALQSSFVLKHCLKNHESVFSGMSRY